MSEAPYPICPRCNTLVGPDTTRMTTGAHLWHIKCRAAYERDREWLTEAEVEGGAE
jgi:hypothetical protein